MESTGANFTLNSSSEYNGTITETYNDENGVQLKFSIDKASGRIIKIVLDDSALCNSDWRNRSMAIKNYTMELYDRMMQITELGLDEALSLELRSIDFESAKVKKNAFDLNERTLSYETQGIQVTMSKETMLPSENILSLLTITFPAP